METNKLINIIRTSGLPKDAQDVVEHAFNHMLAKNESQGCLLISITMCIALEYLGYKPRLCIGKIWVKTQDSYHAWIELDGKVIDVAIFGNTVFTPDWRWGEVLPQIYRAYNKTDIKYEPFVFDFDVNFTWVAQVMGWSFFEYCENAPKHLCVWVTILSYLNTSSPVTLSDIKEISKKHIIGEK